MHPAGRPVANGRILLAHANGDCQKIYGTVLAYDGYEVDVVSDVESALARIATVPVDLVVTDLYLPSGNDECLLRRMRTALGSHLPVVVLTGWATETHRRLAIDEGADRYLALPIRPRELVAIVGEMLGEVKRATSAATPFAEHHDRPAAKGI